MKFKLNILLKLILSAVATFFVIKLWVFGVDDPNEPREWPYLMFDVVGWFVLTFPLIASVIVFASEESNQLRRWAINISLTLSILFTFVALIEGNQGSLNIDYLTVTVAIIIFVYCFIVSSGIFLLTCRLAIGLSSLVRYLALKSM